MLGAMPFPIGLAAALVGRAVAPMIGRAAAGQAAKMGASAAVSSGVGTAAKIGTRVGVHAAGSAIAGRKSAGGPGAAPAARQAGGGMLSSMLADSQSRMGVRSSQMQPISGGP